MASGRLVPFSLWRLDTLADDHRIDAGLDRADLEFDPLVEVGKYEEVP